MSESNSDTSQSTNQTDNRRVIGQGGVSAEGGSNVTINTLDGDVINRVVAYGGDVTQRAIGFGNAALDLVGGTVSEAFGFGGKALSASLDAQKDALAFADANSARMTAASFNFADDAFAGALSFGANALNKAFGASENASALVKDAYADAKGRGALTDKILIGAVLAMAVVAFAAVKK